MLSQEGEKIVKVSLPKLREKMFNWFLYILTETTLQNITTFDECLVSK